MKVVWFQFLYILFISLFQQGGLIDNVYSNQLVIALEPEAASLYCRTLPASTFSSNKESTETKATFEPGTKYLVVDAGGKSSSSFYLFR